MIVKKFPQINFPKLISETRQQIKEFRKKKNRLDTKTYTPRAVDQW